MAQPDRFPAEVARTLNNYVYLYIDPRDRQIFYVGRGKGNRCFSHLSEIKESDKVERLDELRSLGMKPRIELLRYGISEDEAKRLETAAIDLLGVDVLTNCVRGSQARTASRVPVEHVVATLNPRPAKIIDRVIIININRLYRADMSDQELYDCTRSAWRVHPERHNPEFALSVFRSVVREVYRIAAWLPHGATMLAARPGFKENPREGRYEFVGTVAEPEVRDRYRNRTIPEPPRGAQNPIRYENC